MCMANPDLRYQRVKGSKVKTAMAYKKFQADQLFTGYEILDEENVLIVSETGCIEDIVSKADAGDDIERHSGLLTPGLVNCHCHLELSHLKNVIPPGTGLIDFLS